MTNKDNGGPASDRELLEMAAKAAHENGRAVKRYVGVDVVEVLERADGSLWMPYLDDGDALRLAVIVGIDVDQYGDRAETWKAGLDGFIVEPYSCDPCAATRRAIVRAAAAIGSAV